MTLYISVNPVGSKFAKALQSALREQVVDKVFRVDHQKARQKVQRIGPQRAKVFNVTPQTLNKVQQFNAFTAANVSCPSFATTLEAARAIDCKTLFARTLINATSGRGIVEFERDAADAPRAPLYTEYIPKKAEYRAHVFNGQVIDIQQKKKKREFQADTRDTRIRNLSNGYVYTRDGIVPPAGLSDLAVRAVEAVGYEYGAVDIIYNEKRNACYVLEVNSRPGLMGTTVEKYTDALINSFNLRRK